MLYLRLRAPKGKVLRCPLSKRPRPTDVVPRVRILEQVVEKDDGYRLQDQLHQSAGNVDWHNKLSTSF